MKKLFFLCAVLLLMAAQTVWAQEKSPVFIQGVALDSEGVPMHIGNKTVTFTIYAAPDGGAALWSEQQLVPIEEGRFKAALGKNNSLDLAFDQQYWLGMKIGAGEELKPRIALREDGISFRITRPKEVAMNTQSDKKGAKGGNGNLPVDMDPTGGPTIADQVILDDLIVDGSACIGMDCVNGENFGFDTIRIKENNLRIRAVDTSSTSSFPSNDWQLTFNDSANGGANKFSIDDIDGGRTPFTIEAGAPSHSLYVDDGGRIGLGTSTPVVDVHVKSGNTPTMRLEQDGSNGFTPQTWDVAGNEANFFIRDATNGSTLPFKIEPGSPSNSIYIDSNAGRVGLGTTAPGANLHIKDSNGTEGTRNLVTLENNGRTQFTLNNTAASSWSFDSATLDRLLISRGGTGVSEVEISGAGDVIMLGNLTVGGDAAVNTITLDGVVQHTSDKRYKKNINNIDYALEKVMSLRGVHYEWRQNEFAHKRFKAGTQIGFIAQEIEKVVPELVKTNADGYKSVAYTNLTPILVEAIKEQQKIIDEQRAEIAGISSRLAKIEAMLQRSASGQTVRTAATSVSSSRSNVVAPSSQSRQFEAQVETDENGRALGSTPQN